MSRTAAFPAHPSGSRRNPGSCRRPVTERADSGLHRDTRRSPLRLQEVDARGRAGTASTGGARRRTAFAWLVLAALLLLAGRPALTGGAWEPVVKGPAAFDRRCIPPDCVVPRSHMPNMLPRHALPGGRLAGLGARRGFTTGSWSGPQDRPESSAAPDALEPPEPPEPGSELRVWLVTAGPGDAVWERYGHNALRVLDTRTGRDVSYNWGFFDFRQEDFIPRFLQGRMLYMMAPLRTDGMIEQYREADREVVLQELDLTPAERAMLRDAANENALPRNRDYAYQYFLDNCSTRVRDLLDRVLGGALKQAFDARPTGLSYRDHTRRLTQVDPLIYTGTNLLLGTPTDRPISAWEELFLPLALRDRIRSVRVTRDGETRPLVRAEEVAVSSARSAEPAEPPAWLGRYLALGLLLGVLFGAAGTPRVRASTGLRRGVLALAAGWSFLAGGVGTILVLLLATDHTFAWWNENLFLFHPLALGLGVLLPLSTRSEAWRSRARALAVGVAVLGLAGLLWQLAPASTQRNAMFLALALPPHLGIAWSLRRPRADAPADRTGGAATT